jgi:hypothetical protein
MKTNDICSKCDKSFKAEIVTRICPECNGENGIKIEAKIGWINTSGYSEEQVSELLKMQRQSCERVAYSIMIDEGDILVGVNSKEFLEKIENASEPPLPSSQSITDEEIEGLAIDFVLVKYPKLRGYTNIDQIDTQDSYIAGFKKAISLTSTAKIIRWADQSGNGNHANTNIINAAILHLDAEEGITLEPEKKFKEKDLDKKAKEIALKFAKSFQNNYPDKQPLWKMMLALEIDIINAFKEKEGKE